MFYIWMMEYRQLDHTTLNVSAIGFGCMSLGHDQQENSSLIHEAIERGVRLFDTADLYDKGWNEETVGYALKGKRDKVILATKVGNQWKPDGSGWIWNTSKAYILSAIDRSLQRLKTDHIDLYQLHGGTINDPIDDTIEAFEVLKQSGKIGEYGISSIRPNVIREYVKRSSIASVMMQYSLLDRRPEEESLHLLVRNNKSVLSRGGLAQGLLVNKPPKEYLGHSAETVASVARFIRDLSGPARTPAQTALRFVLQQPGITAAICGIRKRDQLAEIAGTTGTPPLTPGELSLLMKKVSALTYQEHR